MFYFVLVLVLVVILIGVYVMSSGVTAVSGGGSVKGGMIAELPGPGTFEIKVVGVSHYQRALNTICGGKTEDSQEKLVKATLVHEDENPHDNKAIRVDIDGMTVGHLDRKKARKYRNKLKEAGHPGITAECSAVIVGGWKRGFFDRGFYGVILDLPRGGKTQWLMNEKQHPSSIS